VDEVRACGVVDVAEGGMAEVARTVQHGIGAVDLAGKEHAVAVEVGDVRIDELEPAKITGLGEADGRGVPALGSIGVVAPCHVVGAIYRRDARVVLETAVSIRLGPFGVRALEQDWVLFELPLQAVVTEAGVQARLHTY